MAFCGNDKTYRDQPQYFDPLGPASLDKKGRPEFQPTGGIPLRTNVFNYLSGYQPKLASASEDLASGLRTAAGNAGWGEAQDMARRTMAGDYLAGSPQLDAAMDANYARQMASAADSSARLRSNFAQNGMAFSTAHQQADQMNQAAAAADASANNAQVYLQNYLSERGNQQMAPQMLEQATSAPLNYLSNVSTAYTAPLSQEAQIISGLASGGPIATPQSTIARQPGVADYMMGGMSSLNL